MNCPYCPVELRRMPPFGWICVGCKSTVGEVEKSEPLNG